jgi:phage shock protein PspC (stress-responsive transcriptional regulator)
MNKTITINLGGVVFNIEEDAFNRLKAYVENLKSRFTKEDGSEEIIADIESRMAELLKEKLHVNKSALTLSDIDSVIAIMGKPEDYGDFQEPSPGQTSYEETGNVRNKNRKLYRDQDDAVIGGVCAGISHYLGWDPSIPRIILVLAVIFGGTGILLYIILWAVVPAAKTRAEKLQMKGEPVTVDNISKMVKDEMDKVDERINGKNKKFGSEFTEKAREFGHSSSRVFEVLIGGFLIIISLGILISLIGGFIGMNVGGPFNSDNFSVSYADQLLFNGDGSLSWLVAAGTILVVVPLIAMVYSGIKLLLGIRTKIPGLGWALGILFILGLTASIFLGINVGKKFTRDADNSRKIDITSTSDTLYVGALENPYFQYDIDSDDREFFELIKETENLRIYGEPITLYFESTNDTEFSMVIRKESNGGTTTEAHEYLQRIQYNYVQTGDSLSFDTFFSTPKNDPFRGQNLNVKILVPKGKSVSFGQGLERIYWNEENIGKTLQMGDNKWMQEHTLYRPPVRRNDATAI